MNHRQGFRLLALASAIALAAACQAPQPTAPSRTGAQASAGMSEGGSAEAPTRKLMAVADAAELEAAFAATFSAESEFGGAPDAEALFNVIKTPEGRAAGAIALRGKNGWIYLVPAGSGTQTASTYRLSAAPAKKAVATPTDPRDLHPPDEARIRAAVDTMVPWGSSRTKKKSFKLQQVAQGGGTLGPTVDNHAFNRKVANSIVPGPASQLPEDPWTYDPDTNTVTLPGVNGPGADISELRGCPTVSEGMINDFARVGGLITVLYAGIPNIFGCDLYAGYTALRWFSGEVVPMQPSFYTLCTGAVQTYPFNSGVINTRVQCTFTIPSRDPVLIPDYIDDLTLPEKKDYFCPSGPDSHFPGKGFNTTPTRPTDVPIVWENGGGAPPIVGNTQPDSGLRDTGTPTPAPSQSPSPGTSTPPTPGPSAPPSPGSSSSPTPEPSQTPSVAPTPTSTPTPCGCAEDDEPASAYRLQAVGDECGVIGEPFQIAFQDDQNLEFRGKYPDANEIRELLGETTVDLIYNVGMCFVAPEFQAAKLTAAGVKASWYGTGVAIASVKANYAAGKKFEQIGRSIGINLNTNGMEVLVNGHRVRYIPDIFDRIGTSRLLGDLKAVKYLCQTRQSKAMMAHYDDLKLQGKNPVLVYILQTGTKISEPLKKEILSRDGHIAYFKMEF